MVDYDIFQDIYHSTKKDTLLKLITKEQAEILSETLSQKTCMHIIEKMFDSKLIVKNAYFIVL